MINPGSCSGKVVSDTDSNDGEDRGEDLCDSGGESDDITEMNKVKVVVVVVVVVVVMTVAAVAIMMIRIAISKRKLCHAYSGVSF